MAKNYKYCSGSTLTTVSASLSAGSCGSCTSWVYGDCDYEECYVDLTFTLSEVAISAITLHYSYDYSQIVVTGSGNFSNNYTGTDTVIIPAGQLQVVVNRVCTLNEDCIGGQYDDTDYQTWENWTLLDQPTIPVCAPPPPTCFIDITGNTITAPIIRGDSDGSVKIYTSGTTGQTLQWKKDGTLIATNTNITGYTFTGLEAGSYTFLVVETGDTSCFDQAELVVPDGEFRTGDFNLTIPEELCASENPIMLTLQTALNSAAPVPSKSTFEITSTITDGNSIVIALDYPQAYTATFYAKGFPDKDSYFLASVLTDDVGNTIGSNTSAEIATSLGEVLLNDSVLNRLYYIRVSGDTVYLEAKENNGNLDLNTGTVTIVGNIDLTLTQAGISAYDGQIESNYSLYTEINVNADSQYGDDLTVTDFNRVTELDLPFSQDNVHKFDLSEVLKNFVTTPKIDFSITGATTLASMMASYYISYGEKYPLIPNSSTKKKRSKGSTDIKYVINSALEWEDVNSMNEYLGDLVSTGSTIRENIKFLTNAPNPKFIQRNSSEFLYFIIKKNYDADLSVIADLYFYDGTSLTGQTLYTVATGGTNYGGVFCVPSGYNELGLASYETYSGGTRKIRKVDFAVYQTITGTTSQLTEERSYRYEIDEQPRRYGVAFLNKRGTWDIFDFSGEIIDSVEHSNIKYQIPRKVSLQGASSRGFQANTVYGTKVLKTITCNTGWINEEAFDWLIELLSSNRIYNYTDTDQPFLITKSVDYKKSSNDDLFQIDVIFNETLEQNNISI